MQNQSLAHCALALAAKAEGDGFKDFAATLRAIAAMPSGEVDTLCELAAPTPLYFSGAAASS